MTAHYYKEMLEHGCRYEDFVYLLMYGAGTPVVGFTSKLMQRWVGENLARMEIKFDRRMAKTGNLWIETEERPFAESPDMVPAGIGRGDSREFAIGNWDTLYRIPTRWLRDLREKNTYPIRMNGMESGRGFLLPEKHAEEMAHTIHRPGLETTVEQIMAGPNAEQELAMLILSAADRSSDR